MMNRMVNKEFAQEIAAVIRTAQNGDRLPELLKHYHQRDVAKAVTLLTDAERERLFRQLDARTLAEIFPYLDDASRFLAELPADLAAAVITDMDTADALDMLRELPAEKKQALFNQMNSGEVRVLLGSTAKCGAGMNSQQKMIALHHLDAPLRPSDVEQPKRNIEKHNRTSRNILNKYAHNHITFTL